MDTFTIHNPEPLVVLFGPTYSGKTTLSIRLLFYLFRKGYRFSTDNALSSVYVDCWKNEVLGALEKFGTAYYDIDPCICTSLPLLTMAYHHEDCAKKIQILDNPGECCKCPLPQYMQSILASKNKKIWVFVLDGDLSEETQRGMQDQVFHDIYDTVLSFGKREDNKIIFVVNKADMWEHWINVSKGENIEDLVNTNYNHILEISPFTTESSWLGIRSKRKNYRIIPFSSYTIQIPYKSDDTKYPENMINSDKYPELLWHTIQDALRNNF